MAAKKQIRVAKARPAAAPARPAAPVAPPPPPPPPPRRPPRRGTKTSGNPLVMVAVIGLIITAITVTIVLTSKRQAREQRRLALAIEQMQESGAGYVRRIAESCEAAEAQAATLPQLQRLAEQGVRTVLDQPLRRSPQRPVPVPAAASAVDEAAPSVPVRDPSAPVGIPTREELEARRRRAAAAPAPSAAAGATTAAEMRVLADAFTEAAEQLEDNVAIASDLRAFANRELTSLRREIRPDLARQRLASLATREGVAEELLAGSREALDRAREAAQRIDQLRQRHELAEKERREQEEAARRAREQAELEQRELTRAETYRKQADELIANNQFEDALDAVERQMEEFQTERARAVHRVTLEQCRELAQLKTFLAESLNASPMSWGWNQTPPVRDILGADRNQLVLRGSTVAWKDVSKAQVARIIEHFLGDGRTSSVLTTRHALGAALFYHKAGEEQRAAIHLERAGSLQPSLLNRARVLMPAVGTGGR